MTTQRLEIDGIARVSEAAASQPTYLSGKRMYAIGSMGGGIIPVGDEHLIGKMGGIWAHPFRVLDGWQAALASGPERKMLTEADECIVTWSSIERRWHSKTPLPVRWCEWIAADRPVAYVQLHVENPTDGMWRGALELEAVFDLRPCWFGGIDVQPTLIRSTPSVVQASTDNWHAGWGAALGSIPEPSRISLDGVRATLHYALHLEPHQTQTILVALVAEAHAGAVGAAQAVKDMLLLGNYRLAEHQASISSLLRDGVHVHTPDQAINEAWQLAKLNFHALEADYPPALGQYFLAGLPEYPQLFGCDSTYSTVGALAAGFRNTMLSALEELAVVAWRQCGRVPHELTTNGRTFNPGNIQETPQFALAVWDAVRWTGDRDLLKRMYPLCREGLREYLVAGHGWHGAPYLWGDGMVERSGMGIFKLDVQCYAIRSFYALADMADWLGKTEEAKTHRTWAEDLRQAFEEDWWMPDEGLYADSRHSTGKNQLDGHWTVMLPVQLGVAAPDRAAKVLERVMNGWVNEYGLVHTREREERVWTLPTGLLAMALCDHGRGDDALTLIKAIASTADVGLLGAFEELIPQGLCFIQLWSAGLVIEAIISGLLGIRPDAFHHRMVIQPCLPGDWNETSVQRLHIGQHTLDITIRRDSVTVQHRTGEQPFGVDYIHSGLRQHAMIVPGETATLQYIA